MSFSCRSSLRQLIDTGDQQDEVVEWVPRCETARPARRKQRERQARFLVNFVPPLLDQAAGCNDEHALASARIMSSRMNSPPMVLPAPGSSAGTYHNSWRGNSVHRLP